MAERMSLRKYAESRRARGLPGGTLSAVQKAIAAGRISLIDGKIDPEVADIQWGRKTDAAQQARGLNGGHPPREQPNGESTITPPESNGGRDPDRDSYFGQKARRERAEAELAELELLDRLGKLIDADETKKATFNAFRTLRDRLLTIPDRTSPIIAAESDVAKVHEIQTMEMKAALREVAQLLSAEIEN